MLARKVTYSVDTKPASSLQTQLYQYSVVPSKEQQAKLKYYYGAYNPFFNVDKHMKFEDNSAETKPGGAAWDLLK